MIGLLVYMLFGLALAWRLLPSQRGAVKCWLGLVFGCVALMWLPCLPAFFLGFTLISEYIALAAALIATAVLAVEPVLRTRVDRAGTREAGGPSRRDAAGVVLSLLGTAFCAYLLHTHVILPHADGSLWVGQSTYGDLAMHLGFVESLFRQDGFPPDYSIFPGQQLNYPFLVDAASASLRFFGLSLRMSVIVPSIVMLFCVFWGFWLLADKLTDRLAPTLLSWLLFFGNGGFGFVYFLGKYDFSDIFTGYYTTPTNLFDEDIRWVNVICDMLIPQRTTMAGWCVLLAAIFLLITALEKTLGKERAPLEMPEEVLGELPEEAEERAPAGADGRREFIVLAVLAGTMPMIHTHSFLALGVLSAVWFFCTLPRARRAGRARTLFTRYVLYGVVCLGMAVPQLLTWTMDSVRTGNLLRWNLGWVVGQNGALTNWLWFYVVNCGVVFVAMWPMLFSLRGEQRSIFLGGAAIFLLANVVAFQPNLYDNNKLLYVWYMLTDILVCRWLCLLLDKLSSRAVRGALAGAFVLLGMLSGVLSQVREVLSEYPLLGERSVAAADFIVENTPPDSLFLTSTTHTNAVAVLTGRNIVCGSGLFLAWHGVNYEEREQQVERMYRGGEDFLRVAAELGVDYVYISGYEYRQYEVNYDWFAENYPLIYAENGISIFQIDG